MKGRYRKGTLWNMAAAANTYGLARSLAIYYGPFWKRRRMERFYGQFVAKEDLCFDIGAHVGNRVRAWRQLGARIIAVEPQPGCVRILRYLYGRDSAVEIIRSAVGSAAGRTILYASSATPALSTIASDWVQEVRLADRRFASVRWDRQVPVRVTTLDALIARYGEPVFCKIDVEGGEAAVLEGLSHPISALSFEFLPAAINRAHACIDRLRSLGQYRFRWSLAETMRWARQEWIDGDAMKQILSEQPSEGRSGDVYARLAS